MKSLSDYINDLLARGKYFFTKQDVFSELGLSTNQFMLQAYRLAQKKAVKRLVKDFYMIIPAEYYHLGSLPPHWIVDPLMSYLDKDYYIAILSAASLYGATEQQPMTFQVITNKPTRAIVLERGGIDFHTFKNCSTSQKAKITVPTGYANISTKEQTLVDLIRFSAAAGHLSNVAAVIRTLAPECIPANLIHVVAHEPTKSVLQRLGYILEFVGFSELAKIVEQELSRRKIEYILLRPESPHKKGEKVSRWKLVLNDSLELS